MEWQRPPTSIKENTDCFIDFYLIPNRLQLFYSEK